MNCLMIGPGPVRREGWLRLDANPKNEPDFLATIPPLPEAVRLIQWDEIEWIHGIGSLYPWDAETVLRELRVVLRPSGRLVLEQPDAHIAAANYVNGAGPLFWLFGDPQHRDPLIMNHWAYTPETLRDLLRACGFTEVACLPAQYHHSARDFRMEATTV